MTTSEIIRELRLRSGLDEADFACLLRVPAAALRGLENGTLGADDVTDLDPVPFDYASPGRYDPYAGDLATEFTQCAEEGLDVAPLRGLFDAVAAMPYGPLRRRVHEALFFVLSRLPAAAGYPYDEPSDLESILAARTPDGEVSPVRPDPAALEDKLRGAWYGRICGCLLGKPVEGIRSEDFWPLLRETGNWPLHRYLLWSDMTDGIVEKTRFDLRGKTYADTVPCAPVDDDTNYTALAQLLIEEKGRGFTSEDVAAFWLRHQPKDAYFTAEQITFRNLTLGYAPPFSARFRNPYREWIGAQIRGDYFGYINPGDSAAAAEMAWRDARISHVKNGIYGEMFAAAMIAAAAVTDDLRSILFAGLAQIPARSRLREAVLSVVAGFERGVSYDDCVAAIHRKYDEHTGHGWCHTISNAMIVSAALLYGRGDFGRSICLAVQACFDTDCNGATVGSVIGMRNGASAVDAAWTAPLNGTLETSIVRIGAVSIDRLVSKTLEHIAL
jgi:ADP-ribosylglycohydrolase